MLEKVPGPAEVQSQPSLSPHMLPIADYEQWLLDCPPYLLELITLYQGC